MSEGGWRMWRPVAMVETSGFKIKRSNLTELFTIFVKQSQYPTPLKRWLGDVKKMSVHFFVLI